MKRIVGVIPARLESTRLPRKMLRDVCGKSLLQRTYERALEARTLADTIVACDDAGIQQLVESFGGKAVLTDRRHPSGTARIAEVARNMKADVFVNIQGDEPLMDPEAIDAVGCCVAEARDFHVGTAAVNLPDEAEYRNPNVVKVVTDHAGFALYFSRAPLPFFRDGGFKGCLKHLGLYAYSREFLVERWSRLERSPLEEAERLEQLRILQGGYRIRVMPARKDSIGVDTEEDLRRVEALLKEAGA